MSLVMRLVNCVPRALPPRTIGTRFAVGVLLTLLMILLSPASLSSADDAAKPADEAKPCEPTQEAVAGKTGFCSALYEGLHCPKTNHGSYDGVWWYDVWKKQTCLGGLFEGIPHPDEVEVCPNPSGVCNACIPLDSAFRELRTRQQRMCDANAEFKVLNAATTKIEYNGYAKLPHFGTDHYFRLFTIITKEGNSPTRVRHCGVEVSPQGTFNHAAFSRDQQTGSEYVHFIDVRFIEGGSKFDVTFRVTSVDPL